MITDKSIFISFLLMLNAMSIPAWSGGLSPNLRPAPCNVNTEPAFTIARDGRLADIVTDSADWKGVQIAASNLAGDIGKVTGKNAELSHDGINGGRKIIAGTIGRSALIDSLAASGRLNIESIRGQWEAYIIDVVDGNLVIAGSDKRGTIYGIYEISNRIGVSPWHFWADVPVKHSDEIKYCGGRIVQPSPKVKYRGIFINDEWPSFGGWATNYYGGVNSHLYASIFELLLRLKANYMWPAMWDSRFNEDDPESPRIADEYGIVMGTSHHEPMMRAHKEYVYRKDSVGDWNYSTNKKNLDRFFHEGLQRNKKYENIVTIGMRGDGDVAMGRGDDAENMRVLRDVIDGQRGIIGDVYGSPDGVPQLWAVFTEVQRYYDAGFSVPEDVTVLFCDNNWGYIRRTAPPVKRRGGYGLYYHIDMNGGPWNDRWVNTSPLPKLREQLSLAYKSGIDEIWIVNVGDLKPKELPIDFIMSYAWDPEAITPGEEKEYLVRWAEKIFGSRQSTEIAEILAEYPKYNLWRKAEVQVPGIFSVENYNEVERTDSLWLALEEKAEKVRTQISPEMQDAYYQLVYYPAVASAGVARLYNAVTKNHHYASLGDPRANEYARVAKELFERDSILSEYYNKKMSGGKWDGMMQDKHIGYKEWFMPERNILPELRYVDSSEVKKETVAERRTAEFGIAAMDYDRNLPAGPTSWILLPDLGRGDGCMGINDVCAPSSPGGGAALEYDFELMDVDSVTIAIGILPTQDINPARGLRLGVEMDGLGMKTIDAREGFIDTFAEYTPENLARSKVLQPLPPTTPLTLKGTRRGMRNEIFDNMRWLVVRMPVKQDRTHTMRLSMIDPEIVLEKIVINPDDDVYSYFGPPSRRCGVNH